MELVWILAVVLGAYVIGSFPTGYLIVKLAEYMKKRKKKDCR